MLNAKEAKNIAETTVSEAARDALNTIENSIIKAANAGLKQITTAYPLKNCPYGAMNQVMRVLKENGYTIETHSDQREGSWMEIKW